MGNGPKTVKIGVIGGGKRCKTLLEMLDEGRLPAFNAEVLAVADPDVDAAGIRLAQRKGIFTTGNYQDFHEISGLDFVVDLTGNKSHIEDFRRDDPSRTAVLELTISKLLCDMIQFRTMYLFEKRQLDINEGIVESIFASIHDGVILLSPGFKILDANEAFLKLTGKRRDAVVGKSCHETIHCMDQPCEEKGELCPVIESLETRRSSHVIHGHNSRNGKTIYCEVTVVPLKNAGGEVELLIAIMRDITAELERRVEEKTRKFKMNLARLIHEDKMIALGKLVSSAVHEINNPLSGILALARLMYRTLEEEKEDLAGENIEQFKYYLHLIDTEAARCGAIVGNLLSFSRLHKVEYRYFLLNDVIRKVILLFRHKAQLQDIEIRLELSEDLPRMFGDPGQIQQCLVNLLFNAMEAMPHGGWVVVRSYLDAESKSIGLEIEDCGSGIPEDMMSMIFEPFFSSKHNEKGVGLGLSVVYGIIKDHGGSIFVKSEVGKGARFIIHFSGIKPAEA